MPVLSKDPASTVDYSLDWSDILADGETIIDVEWSISPVEDGGLALGSTLGNGYIRGVYVTGGLEGHQYRLFSAVTTDKGRTITRSMSIRAMRR